MPSVRSFQFNGLPRWTREQVAVSESFSAFLSLRPFRPDFTHLLGQSLEPYLKVPCKFSQPEAGIVGRAEIAQLLPRITCLLVIGAAPTEHKILVDLDTGIAGLCIDRLLGGKGDAARIQRPLTEIEEGVLSFVLLKILSEVHEGWQTGRELTLTLDRFASRFDDVQSLVDAESGYHVLGIKIALGKRIGYARVLLPQSLVTKRFSATVDTAHPTDAELARMRAVLNGLGEQTISFRVEAANLDLSADDIASLEVGDIILLENHQISRTPEGIEGEAFVRVGDGSAGGLRGRVINEGELSKLQISEIILQEQPPEEPMADSEPHAEDLADAESSAAVEQREAPPPDDNLAEAEGLLRNVPAPVVVELGRLKLNTSQVIRLRPGQILRLPRGPNDPVNLVVNGRLFARGELIEVDGELGVRLLQVVGT